MKAMIQTAILAALSVAFIVACGKKSSDSAAQQPPPPMVQPCVMGQVQPPGFVCINGQLINNPAGTGDLASGAQFTTSYISGSVSVGSMNGMGGLGMGNGGVADPTTALYSYSGQVNVSGTLQVLNPNGLCNAPAGTYNIQGTGTMAYASVSNLNLTVSGPIPLTWQIYNAAIYRDYAGALRFGVTASVIYVNGANCGSVVAY